jgi:transcriptional regulator with XRE-family HTH domain
METLAESIRLRRTSLPPPVQRRAIRVLAGATQQDVAFAIGTTRAAVTRYENGTREPRGELRLRYAEVLEVLRGV